MKVVIQRVSKAHVTVDQKMTGSIGMGLLLLVGVGQNDNEIIATRVAQKIVALRVFADEFGKMNRSILEIDGEVLVVPQFTLFAELKGQNRPYFGEAADPEKAKQLFDQFVDQLRMGGIKKVAAGVFGAYMQVELINDGPVTLTVESSEI